MRVREKEKKLGRCLLINSVERMVTGKRSRRCRQYKMLDDIKVKGRYALMKKKVDRGLWKADTM